MKHLMSVIPVVSLLFISTAALGHHSFAAEFDTDLDGTIVASIERTAALGCSCP